MLGNEDSMEYKMMEEYSVTPKTDFILLRAYWILKLHGK